MKFFKRLFKKQSSKEKVSTTVSVTKEDTSTEKLSTEKGSNLKNTDAKQRKYHVSMNHDPNSSHYKMWRVRKEHSDKTIKYFKTQKEAIAYAESLADHADSYVVVHKVDGSFRKKKYH